MKTTSKLGTVLVIVWMGLGWGGCNREDANKAAVLRGVVAEVTDGADANVVPVQLVAVSYVDTALPVRVSGTLSRRTEAVLSFKIGGVVDVVSVRAGEAVTAGQPLAQLQLVEIDAQVEQARSGLAKAQRDLERVERLERAAVATTENLQDARTMVEQAAAQMRVAEFNRQHAVILAPAVGRILRRSAEPGEGVAPGRSILTFGADEDGWLLRGGVADRDAARLAPGDSATLSWAAGEVAGRILQIGDAVDPTTGMVPLEVQLDQVPEGARSGSVAEAMIQPKPVKARPRVPVSALLEARGRMAAIFVVAKGEAVARRVAVEVEVMSGEMAYLRTSLPAEVRVVARGAEYLTDGAPVRAVEQ